MFIRTNQNIISSITSTLLPNEYGFTIDNCTIATSANEALIIFKVETIEPNICAYKYCYDGVMFIPNPSYIASYDYKTYITRLENELIKK